MNKFLIPLVIVLSSLLYSLIWNQYRQPYCDNQVVKENTVTNDAATEVAPLPPVVTEEEPPAKQEPAEVPATPIEKALFESLDVHFATGSSSIIRTPEVNEWLENAKKYLAENPDVRLSLVGHTDNTGPAELNQKISEKRAASVRDILITDGFAGQNLVISGKGMTEPIADNGTDDGRAKNRRVSIKLIQ